MLATPQMSWTIREAKSTFGGANYQIKWVVSDRMMFAFENQVSSFSFLSKQVECVIDGRSAS